MAAWSPAELADVQMPWPSFHAKHPDRSFNAWEVKRRRVGKDALTALPSLDEIPGLLSVPIAKEHLRIGLVSDTHLGSKFEQLSALRAFYTMADAEPVDFYVHAGDLVQGSDRMHLGMELEVHAHGADAQARYAAAVYPRSPVKTYIVGGNHDHSFHKDGGQNIVRQIADLRDDLVFAGQDAAYLSVEGLRSYVIHPDGAGSILRTRRIVEGLQRGIGLVLVGHYHSYQAFTHKDVFVLQLPAFQGQYAWMARRGLVPDIAGLILDVWLDDSGAVARIAHEVIPFREVRNDWDRAASEEANAAWSVEGIAV